MKKRTRYLIFLLCLIFGGYFLIPTVQWYFLYDENDRQEARLDGDKLKREIDLRVSSTFQKLKDGEDLKEELKALKKEFINEIKIFNKANPTDKIATNKKYTYQEMNDLLMNIKGKEKRVKSFFRSILEDYYIEFFSKKTKVKESIIKLGLDLQGGAYAVVTVDFDHPSMKDEYPKGIPKNEKEAMIDSAILKIENRINKYGLSETSIQKLKEQEKIIINLPGVKEATELRQIIETVGVLEFKLVSKEGSDILNRLKMEADRKGVAIFDEGMNLIPEYQSKLNKEIPDTQALPLSNKDKFGREQEVRDFLVVEKESLLGKNVKILNASVQQDNLGRSVVNFELGDDAAKKWAKITEAAAKDTREIAIILDDVILEHPMVREKIPNGRSQITLGDAPIEELRTLSLILRAGSLNVPLEISEEHTVGASLGKDTIVKGIWAIFIGLMFVLAFMIIWYNVGGLIADFALFLNLLLLMGGLALFRGTLTLPGIAGVILTVGMSVDANVIIFERIKEEFRSGKTFKTAVNLGFSKAFWTIVDANLTTFAAGIGLSLFGTGPLKGFAVTLCLGIIISLFTALFVSRLIFDTLLNNFEFKSLRVLSLLRGK